MSLTFAIHHVSPRGWTGFALCSASFSSVRNILAMSRGAGVHAPGATDAQQAAVELEIFRQTHFKSGDQICQKCAKELETIASGARLTARLNEAALKYGRLILAKHRDGFVGISGFTSNAEECRIAMEELHRLCIQAAREEKKP